MGERAVLSALWFQVGAGVMGGEMLPDPADLVQRLDLSTVASCTCLTKTPEVRFHDPMCRYRILREASAVLRRFMRLEADT